jgi:2-alkyl-3-oxoalkanoate reductase
MHIAPVSGMRIFITGATGVIGRRVVPMCITRGHHVTAVSRSSHGRAALHRLGARGVDADLFDRRRLAALMAEHDAVVNLATHMPSSSLRMVLPGAWRENDRIRRDGSAAMVTAALEAGVGRFVQESFAPVYPDRGDAWIEETTPIDPARYNRTVADAEHSAARFSNAGGAGVVLRFAALYGPDSRFLEDLVRSVRHGFAPLFGPPDAYISSVAHDDAATAVLAALELPTGVYNVVDDEPVSHRSFVDSLADALGVRHPKLPPRWMTALGGSLAATMARSLRVSNRKLKAASRWAPAFRTIRDGWPAALAPFAGRSTSAGMPAAPPPAGASPEVSPRPHDGA